MFYLRIKDGYTLEKRENGTAVIAPDGSDTHILLNEISEYLWELAKTGVSKTEMLNRLLDRFDISTVLALGTIDTFLKTLNGNGITENEKG